MPEQPPPGDDRLRRTAALFGAVAPRYDEVGFLTLAAQEFARRLPIGSGARALDVATGTGTVALALRERGAAEVVGTDLAPEMVEVARSRVGDRAGLGFLQAEATALPFPDAHFDLVACGAGLFFVPDMEAALREWARVTRPGGVVAFSAFGRGLLGPLPGLWREALEPYGLKPAAPPLGRIPDSETAAALLRGAGLSGVQASRVDLTYTLPDPEARWADIEAGVEGEVLGTLDAGARAELRRAHLATLAPLFATGPLACPLPLLLAWGRVPEAPAGVMRF